MNEPIASNQYRVLTASLNSARFLSCLKALSIVVQAFQPAFMGAVGNSLHNTLQTVHNICPVCSFKKHL